MRKDFYVYFLRRPDKLDLLDNHLGQPFYVGQGNNGRHLGHRKEAELLRYKSGQKSIKNRIIHKLWEGGYDFEEDVFIEGLAEQEAFEIEKEAISVYGRIDLGTGCLANMTNGGEGVSGWVVTEEFKNKARNRNLGKKRPEWWRNKISEKLRGRKHSEERIIKNREVNLGKKLSKKQD